MGAHSLTRYVKTEKTLNEAWKELFENEVLENGNDPYSGSFATCKGVVDLGGPVSLVEAEKAAENMFQGIALPEKLRGFVKPMALEKWGRAGAISVLSAEGARIQRKKKTLKTDKIGALYRYDLLNMLENELVLPVGSFVKSAEIIGDKTKARCTSHKASGVAKILYTLKDERGREIKGLGGEDFYKTETEALKAAREYLSSEKNNTANWPVHKLEVVARKLRDGQPSFVEITETSRSLVVEFEICTLKKNPVREGWLFFGMAAS